MTGMLTISGLVAGYGDRPVIDGLDLEVGAGQTVALLGPSGSGKTTLLLAIAGFVTPTAGTISIAGTVVAGGSARVAPERRGVALVFQGYGLWPHMSALGTVAFPLEVRGVPRSEAEVRARDLLERVGMAGLEDRRPAELSGGQQQRVGLARALATEAGLLLLDEPTAHLDAFTRDGVGVEIRARIAESGAAALTATHDAAEALAGGEVVVLMRDGAIVQSGSPIEVYEQPCDEWAARLTGPASVIDGRALGRHGEMLLVRPEWASPGGDLDGVVRSSSYRGGYSEVVLDTSGGPVTINTTGPAPAIGSRWSWTLDRVWPLDA